MNVLKKIMRKLDAFIEEIGIDKVAHFLGGGMIVALFACYGLGIIGFFVNVAIMWARERLSGCPDPRDAGMGILGGLFALLLSFPGELV